MKILMIVLGIAILLGGIGIGVVMMDGKQIQRAESLNDDTVISLQKAEKQYQSEPTDANKKSVEAWRKNADDSGKQLAERKQTQTFGMIGGGILAIIGIGLFGLAFAFGKKR